MTTGLGRHHHSRNREDVRVESHRCGIVSLCNEGGLAPPFFLGHLADRYGRKATILTGLTLFAVTSYLFLAGDSFVFFCVLMALSGIAIGIFKTGALALIGDISRSTAEHTSIMNWAEGFFGIGSILGPAILSQLLNRGIAWHWL